MKQETTQFDAANRAIEQAVAGFIPKVEAISVRWERVSSSYVLEQVLLALCDDMARLIDEHHRHQHHVAPAAMRLSNALADYRDLPFVERG